MASPGIAAARRASGALHQRLSFVGHALRVGGASVALLGTAIALQLVLGVAPNRHDLWLVVHVVGEADVTPAALDVRS